MMFQRISSLILLFCLPAALLHGNAAVANQNQNTLPTAMWKHIERNTLRYGRRAG